MEKKILKQLIAKGKSQRGIAAELGCSKRSVEYWLSKYELTTGWKKKDYQCSCGETDSSKFYGHKKDVCSTCHNRWTKNDRQKKRDRIISYLGGKCVKCGFKKYKSAMDVHHTDPAKKDKMAKRIASWKWERAQKELQHCILLCKNCHSAYHGGEMGL